jgi:hypothetical protein
MCLAIAGGGVFAAFAWETPDDEEPIPTQDRSPADRKDHDDHPSFDMQADALHRPSKWNADQALSTKQHGAIENASGPEIDAARRGLGVREDQTMPGTPIAAGMPHSRSPPDEDAP